jgi:Glycosyltransferase family 92
VLITNAVDSSRKGSDVRARRSSAGIQWMGHYSTDRDDELSIAFFGFDLTTRRASLIWKGPSGCHHRPARSETSSQRSYKRTILLNETLLSRKQLQTKQFYCNIHLNRTATAVKQPAYLIPRSIRDANTHVVHTYVCNVTSVITKSELLKLQLSSDSGAIRVSLEMQDITIDEPKEPRTTTADTVMSTIVDVDLPISGGLGYSAVMMNSSTKSVLTLRAPIVLCAFGGHKKTLKYVREWVVHNTQIGIGVIFLGTTASEIGALRKELKYFIDKGQVILLAAQEMCFIQQSLKVPKVIFYQVCLFHAKSISKYVITYDIDEYWIPSNLDKSSNAIVKAVETVNSNAKAAGCTDWCMAKFKSYNVISANKHRRPVSTGGHNGASYTVRDSEPNSIWQKSVLNTDVAYMNSFHIGGSCKVTPGYATDSANTTSTDSAVVPYTVYEELYTADSCRVQDFSNDKGFFHHFINMVVRRRSYAQEASKGALVLDEYAQFYWSRVSAELDAIAREEASLHTVVQKS